MTKSKGVGRGGRRKGAGRPRFTKTGKTEFFTTRITPQTRSLLEAEAKRCGKSLSVVAEGMLLAGLEKKAEVRTRSHALRALFFLIERLAIVVRGDLADNRNPSSSHKHNWQENPYIFEAFRTGVMEIIEALRPAGDVVKPPGDPQFAGAPQIAGDGLKRPPQLHTFPDAPSEWGNLCAYNLIFSAAFEGAIREDLEERDLPVPMTWGARTHYGYVNAGRDLSLDIRGKRK